MKASMPAYPIDLFDARKDAAATQAHELVREATTLQQKLAQSNILTSSSEMLRIVRSARQVANTDVPVLMLGESGVGSPRFGSNRTESERMCKTAAHFIQGVSEQTQALETPARRGQSRSRTRTGGRYSRE